MYIVPKSLIKRQLIEMYSAARFLADEYFHRSNCPSVSGCYVFAIFNLGSPLDVPGGTDRPFNNYTY
jgi:hypothetical protein